MGNRIDHRAIILGDVEFGSGNIVEAGALLVGPMTVGDENFFGPYCVVGGAPQDDATSAVLRTGGIASGSEGRVSVGSRTVIREFVTVHRGLTTSTVIGDDVYLMAYTHVPHDCTIRDGAKLANNVQMGGYTWIGRGAYLGFSAVLHQFTVIGGHSMVGMGAVITGSPVVPGSMAYGSPARPVRPNHVGLQKLGIKDASWWDALSSGDEDVPVPNAIEHDVAEYRDAVRRSALLRVEVDRWRAQRLDHAE